MASGKLEIREPRVEEINRKSDALYQLIKHLLNTGVCVDAVGFQCHLRVNKTYDWDSVQSNIKRFKDLGLEVYITEFDVSMGTERKMGDPVPADYEKLQAERFYASSRPPGKPVLTALMSGGFQMRSTIIGWSGRSAACLTDSSSRERTTRRY